MKIIEKFKKNQFLFEELVKRDFKQKYKQTVLGMMWSLLSPLLQLIVMSIVFKNFFGRNVEHYTIYLFCGNLIWCYFKDSTNGGMNALVSNAGIFSKVNVPKYMFLLSKNISSLINFLITLIVLAIFIIFEPGLSFSWNYLTLIYPIICLVGFNAGCGLVLSAMYVFFRDTKYLYDIFTLLLMYLSAIFYDVRSMSFGGLKKLFYCNPVYCYIKYFRWVILDGGVPALWLHGLCLFYAVIMIFLGALVYKKFNHKFLYYV